MTIAAGLVCSDGLVLFADSEEQEGFIKTNTEKIQKFSEDSCHLVVANAGNGLLADSLTEQIFDALAGNGNKNEKEVIDTIRQKIIEFHQNEVSLFPSENYSKVVDLVLGLQVASSPPTLMHAQATALRKVREFAVLGNGAEIKFLLQELYSSEMPIKHGILIANYLLETAKRYVQGCGGESRIATLDGQKIEIRHPWDVSSEGDLFSRLAANYRAVLLSIPDENITDEQFHNCIEWFTDEAWTWRSVMFEHRKENERLKTKVEEWRKTDPPGIAKFYEPVNGVGTIIYRYGNRRRKFLKQFLDKKNSNA